MGLPYFSSVIQRAMMGLWVEWKPEMAPHEMTTKSIGMRMLVSGLVWKLRKLSAVSSVRHISPENPLTNRTPAMATAMKSRTAPKTGYNLPMILSTGRSVATM